MNQSEISLDFASESLPVEVDRSQVTPNSDDSVGAFACKHCDAAFETASKCTVHVRVAHQAKVDVMYPGIGVYSICCSN